MNDALKALLSAYLDGQVTPGQRRQIEDLLARDPAARAEWEDLRDLAAKLNAAAPPAAAVPADFREKIMARLKSGTGGPQGPGAAGWTAAGLVLLGLLGTFMVLDRQASQPAGAPQARPSPESLEESSRPAGGAQPEYRGQLQRVNPEDIRSTSPGFLPDALRRQPARLDGEAYLSGAKVVRSKPAAVDLAPAPAVSALERPDAWGREDFTRELSGSSLTAETLAALARVYRLHPGLLLAVSRDVPRLSPEEAARRLRNSLDASAGQPDSERLHQAAKDLGGDPAWLPRWKKYLSFSE